MLFSTYDPKANRQSGRGLTSNWTITIWAWHDRYHNVAPTFNDATHSGRLPAVCLLGPRQVGKTTLAQGLDPTRTYITLDDVILLNAVKQDPMGFVQGLPECVTLDEVQRAPELMPALKASIDANRQPGRFILTGSANLLLLPGVQESLAGRVEVIYLQPLSEQEKHHAKECLLQRLLEVDLVIEQGRYIWRVEVKKAASIQVKDGAGLAHLANQAGNA